MAQYAQTRRLRPEEAAYIAGLVDGEGAIGLTRRHARDNRQLVVSIANTELCLLEFVLDRVGAGKITRKRAAARHHTPSYVYSISNRQALSLIGQLQPYLRSHKRARADLVLLRYVGLTPRNGRYTPELEQSRAAFEEEFFSICSRGNARGAEPISG